MSELLSAYNISKYYKILLTAFLLSPLFSAESQTVNQNNSDSTFVVLLGTGMPRPNPNASGPATTVVYGKKVFLFDVGSGVERQLAAAKLPIDGATATFITHLHSDHTLGYPDLIFTSWVMGRKTALEVYGPQGLKRMTNHIIAAYEEDIKVRTKGLEHQTKNGYKVNVHEIDSGIVYHKDGIKITAFPVPHGNWKKAFAYRIDTPIRSIVISGDTRYNEKLIDFAKGIDVLVHEVYPESRVKPEKRAGGEDWPKYLREFHTSDVELGKLASKIKPKLLILTHLVRMGGTDQELLDGIRKGGFEGKVVIGYDLDRY